jgi:hypothetical protein
MFPCFSCTQSMFSSFSIHISLTFES